MKNRSALLAILLLPLLLSACGKKDAAPSSLPPSPAEAGLASSADRDSVILSAPMDLLACPGFLSIADVRGDAQVGTAVLLSSESVPALVDFYTAQLAADGWILVASTEQDGNPHLQFSQNGRFLRFQISPATDSSGTSIGIAWKQPARATEFNEAHSPEPEEEEPEPGNQGSIEW
jgi:hypothetical protein